MNSDAVSARYSGTAKFLHWLIVGLLIAQYIFGWTMPHIGRTVPVSTLIDLHVSVGILIMFVAVVRLVVRATHGEPVPEDGLPPWQLQWDRVNHWLLYAFLFIVPVLGWMNASWRDMQVSFLGLFELPKLLATRARGWGWTGDVHALLANYVLLGLIGLHVVAALYHYFIRGDRVLQRMLPGTR